MRPSFPPSAVHGLWRRRGRDHSLDGWWTRRTATAPSGRDALPGRGPAVSDEAPRAGPRRIHEPDGRDGDRNPAIVRRPAHARSVRTVDIDVFVDDIARSAGDRADAESIVSPKARDARAIVRHVAVC